MNCFLALLDNLWEKRSKTCSKEMINKSWYSHLFGDVRQISKQGQRMILNISIRNASSDTPYATVIWYTR